VVGVSKLCCYTCEKVLREFNVKFYGAHRKPYPGVLNLNLRITQSPHPLSVLHLKSSPVISPASLLGGGGGGGGGAGAAAGGTAGPATALGRRLSFSPELASVEHDKCFPAISPLSGEDKDALVGAVEGGADGLEKRLNLEPHPSPTRESSVFFDWGGESPFHFVGSPVLRRFGCEEKVFVVETEPDDPTSLGTVKPA